MAKQGIFLNSHDNGCIDNIQRYKVIYQTVAHKYEGILRWKEAFEMEILDVMKYCQKESDLHF